MNIQKKTIQGKLDKTVVYTLENIQFTEIANGVNISWNEFTFHTPLGDFQVEAINEDVLRDPDLDKSVIVKVKKGENVEIIEIFESPETPLTIGLEGDFVIHLWIPSDSGIEITGIFKEVIDGS